jgi:carbonic anhydrase/acetyltransferase-like protein (isoleucine patch superfamily)
MIIDFKGKTPRVDPSVFIAANAVLIGDVEIGSGSNVWFFSLIRGDVNFIRIGARCNIQDACILHVDRGRFPLILEDDVVLGHRATVHGCRVGRGALIGIGATVLSGATIGEEAIVGAGAVVTEGATIPPRTLALGTPARVKRELAEEDFARIRQTRESYQELMKIYGHNAKPSDGGDSAGNPFDYLPAAGK